jgi:PEP-CTERM motif
MRTPIIPLALLAGLTSFAGSAKAAVITANLNQHIGGSPSGYFRYSNGVLASNYSEGGIYGVWHPQQVRYIYWTAFELIPARGSIGNDNGQNAGDGYYNGLIPLPYGYLINEHTSWGTGGHADVMISTGGYWPVRFNAGNGDFNYGYVQVDVTGSGMTFGMAGVETTPNLAITAGAVPEPSTYALLLLSSAASLWALRRRKS